MMYECTQTSIYKLLLIAGEIRNIDGRKQRPHLEGRRLAVREKSRKSLIAFERRIKCLRESPIFEKCGGKKKGECRANQRGYKDDKLSRVKE